MIVQLIVKLCLTEHIINELPATEGIKETETNAKIVDLLKQALPETKRCRNDGNERTPSGKITCALTVAQHLRAVFDSQEWMSVHMDMKINQVVVMYLDIEEILRPVSAPVVSVCKGILTAYSFLFFGNPRHYAMRKYSCWCRACSRVCGRGPGNGTVSRGTCLDVPNCARNNFTV